MKYIKNSVGIIALFIAYIIFLMIGHLIPQSWIEDNVIKSEMILQEQGLYLTLSEGSFWDNWTDSYFINAAITEYEGNVLEKAVANAYTISPGLEMNPVECIRYAIDPSVGETEQIAYSRYWVGSLTLVKVLLCFMDLNGIRALLLMMTVIMWGFTLINIYNCIPRGEIAFIFSTVAMMYIPNSMCLAFCSDIILMLIGINICCLNGKNSTEKMMITEFFIIGSLCSYLAYWSFPLITLGMPVAVLATVRLKQGKKIFDVIKENICVSVSWTSGIVGTVIVKQVLARLILGKQTGTEHLSMWIGTDKGLFPYGIKHDIKVRLWAILDSLIAEMTSSPIIILCILTLISVCIMIKRNEFKLSGKWIPYAIIACYPIAWEGIFYIHCRHGFTRGMYGVSYFSILLYLFVFCKFKDYYIKDNNNI